MGRKICLLALSLLACAASRGEESRHWAWIGPRKPTPPAVKDEGWVKSPMDRFILSKLEAAGLRPAAAARPEELLRRVSFDLTGLPPTPGEIDGFLADSSSAGWERVVDRLLASPHYGERWGKHWLDLARFAETNGYEHDEVRPDAWRYRDYVIRSFNADKPFDRFLAEELAGDELYPGDPDSLIATGFNLLGPDMTDSSDQLQRRQNTLNDMTDTAGLVFLGVTIGCARCHDHKLEPFSQSDYYRLQAFFAPAEFRADLSIASEADRQAYQTRLAEYRTLIRPMEEELSRLEEPYRRALEDSKLLRLSDDAQTAHRTAVALRTPAQRELVEKTARLIGVGPAEIEGALSAADRARRGELQAEIHKFDGRKPAPLATALGLRDRPGEPVRTFVLERGELGSPGEEVQPGFPAVLSRAAGPVPVALELPAAAPGRRAALARWLSSRENPLTARVIVNRLWQHHFGRGIVASPSDFGTRGERPTHPELLDWLAVELEEKGFSLKPLHREILLSAAYRQSSRPSPEALSRDPENRLFSRMNRARLEAEAVRDALLASSGLLETKMGGPGIFPGLPAEVAGQTAGWKPSPDPRDRRRRSVYIFARRNLRFPFLEALDLPDSNQSCPRRERSTTAVQALSLLHAEEPLEAARALAERVSREAASEDQRIILAYRLALGRRPSEEELRLSRLFLAGSPFAELCRALYNLNEFVYVD
jgi:hypothetical protein